MEINQQILYNTLIKMVIPVIAGFVVAKAGVVKGDFAKKLSTLILFVCQPFMLLTATYGARYSDSLLTKGLIALLCGFLAHVIIAIIGFSGTCFFKDKKKGRIIEHCIVFGNCGFFGFPVLQAAFGDVGLFCGGFFVVAFNTVLWSYGMIIIGRANREMKIKLTKIFFNAGTVPCVLGLILYVLRVPTYAPVYDSMKMIGDSCTPLSLILIGIMLARVPLKSYIKEYSTYYGMALKLFLTPIVTGVIMKLLGFSDFFTLLSALMMALPTASSTAMFAETYDLHTDIAAQTVGVSTLVSVVTIPPVMALVQKIIDLI